MFVYLLIYLLNLLNSTSSSYSFGYDSTRFSNLQMLEKDVLVHVAGAFIVIQNYKKRSQRYIQASGNVCYGAVAVSIVRTIVHPNCVAELSHSTCVLSEFVVACVVYCMFWLPYGVINDDDYTGCPAPLPKKQKN